MHPLVAVLPMNPLGRIQFTQRMSMVYKCLKFKFCPKCLLSLKTTRCFLEYTATDMPSEGRGGLIFNENENEFPSKGFITLTHRCSLKK